MMGNEKKFENFPKNKNFQKILKIAKNGYFITFFEFWKFSNTVARRREGIARARATPSERRTQREWYFASRRSRGSP